METNYKIKWDVAGKRVEWSFPAENDAEIKRVLACILRLSCRGELPYTIDYQTADAWRDWDDGEHKTQISVWYKIWTDKTESFTSIHNRKTGNVEYVSGIETIDIK